MKILSRIDFKRVFVFFVVVILIVPFLTFAGNSKKLYVNAKATGEQTGSSKHPYKTISQALKKANKNTKIFVEKGTYKENLVVPKGVQIYGNDKSKTIIEAKNNDDSTVYLNGGAKLFKLTIKKGKNGVKVADGGKVSIIECRIERNTRDGVIINAGKLSDGNLVTISKTDIERNGHNGIYSEKRKITIYNSVIEDNGSDGVSFESGVNAWIEKTDFKENSGSGLKARLDGAQIYTKNNTFANNKREGVEVNAYGATGRIDINKSKFSDNANYAIARVQRKAFGPNIWSGLTVQNASYSKTEKGELSGIFKLFN